MVRVKIASYDVREPAYFRFFLKNATQFIVVYHAGPVVVEVAIDGVGNDIEFLVSHDGRLAGLRFRARHLLECLFGKVAAVGIFAMDHQHGVAYLVDKVQNLVVLQRGKGLYKPSAVRADATRMIATRRFVEVDIILQDLWRAVGSRLGDALRACVGALQGVGGALVRQCFALCMAYRLVVVLVEIVVGIHLRHIIPKRSLDSLTALVRLPTSALPFHLAVARYAFDETSAHLLNNQTKSGKESND